MKQTAVEWLYERLERMIPRTALYNMDKEDYFKKAKEMEKKQIEESFMVGVRNEKYMFESKEEYYNEKFKK